LSVPHGLVLGLALAIPSFLSVSFFFTRLNACAWRFDFVAG
jgi:hypothetical protein